MVATSDEPRREEGNCDDHRRNLDPPSDACARKPDVRDAAAAVATEADGGGGDGGAQQHQQRPPRRRSNGSDDDAEEEEDEEEDEEEEEVEIIDDDTDDQPQRVDDGLFIGAAAAERDLPALQRRGITHVLVAAAEGGLLGLPRHPGALEYLVLPLEDREDEDLVAHLGAAFAFIDAARRRPAADGDDDDKGQHPHHHQAPVSSSSSLALQAAAARILGGGGGALVVCARGRSRSAAVCLAYLMRGRGWAYERALAAVGDVRPVAPNAGFEAQLRRFFGEMGGDFGRWRGWEVERRAAAGGKEEEGEEGAAG